MQKYLLILLIILCRFTATSQLQVRDEPRHHNVFENEFVRILDVYLPPKDTTLYHLHNTPSVFIILANTNVSSQLMDKPPQKGANISGIVTYDSLATPRYHRVWNEDTSWFRVMDIELTSKRSYFNIPPLQNPSLKLLFNEEQVNGYAIEFTAGGTFKLPSSSNGYLLVSKNKNIVDYKINDASQRLIMKAGHYIWIDAGKGSLITVSQTPASFVLLQLK